MGDALEAVSRCPRCDEELEVGFEVGLLLRSPEQPTPSEVEVEMGELRLRARPLTTADLLAAEDLGEVEDVARRLLERSLVDARRGTSMVSVEDLAADEVAALAQALADADPLAEIVFALTCDACGHTFRQPLDPATFLAVELATHARRLLHEVHCLARAYGWREPDVLALSSRRRRAYLELVES